MYTELKAYLTDERWGPILAVGTMAPLVGFVVWSLIEDASGLFSAYSSLGTVLLGGMSLRYGLREFRVRQAVRDTPTSAVRALAVGPAEVEGRARPAREPVEAPLSGKAAAMVALEVEEYHDSGDDGDGYWETVGRYRHPDAFLLDDGTGQVPVEPGGSDVRAEVEDRWTRSAGDQPPDAVAALADHVEADDRGPQAALPGPVKGLAADVVDEDGPEEHLASPGGRRRRYTERILEPGEEAYVLGEARRREGATSTRNERNLTIREPPDGVFVVSDRSEAELRESTRSRVLLYLGTGIVAFPVGVAGALRFLGVV